MPVFEPEHLSVIEDVALLSFAVGIDLLTNPVAQVLGDRALPVDGAAFEP